MENEYQRAVVMWGYYWLRLWSSYWMWEVHQR